MAIAVVGSKALMPREFKLGLNQWSRTNGTPSSPTWVGQANAAIVPADGDFGNCLEILKQESTTSLRYMKQTPISPGCYLRISTRVKAIAGNIPQVRIAGYAGGSGGGNVAGVVQVGPTVTLPGYGVVAEVSAIVGTGRREGVDMPWGRSATFGYFGIDLLGDNNGAIRIENLVIEDVTSTFVPGMLDWVDVRDFGAVGDGVTDDRAAFAAANQAAGKNQLVVPEGTYYIGSDLSLSAQVRFIGQLKMPRTARLALTGKFDFPTYAAAFGDETEGMKRALQALFSYMDHGSLDLCGRNVNLTEPLVISEFAPNVTSFSDRRVITNGQISVQDGSAWTTGVVTSAATYNPANPRTMTNVVNVANIEIGSLVSGNGVGREVYVNARNIAAKTLTLSQPLYGGAATRSYTFTRFRYVLDLSAMEEQSRLNFDDIDFRLNGFASGVMLGRGGDMNCFRDCYFTKPKDRGITSIGTACQGMVVDRCEFLSNEMTALAQNRKTIAINVNLNDVKVRHNRFVRFGHFLVACGGGHVIEGNHWFQGDNAEVGVRVGGLVLTQTNIQTTITGNYIDNNFIEWTNEHEARPNFEGNEYSFGGLTLTGNTCVVHDTGLNFNWLVVKPYGTGHYIQGLTVIGNVFKSLYTKITRIDRVDTTIADLDYTQMRNILFQGNTFNGVLNYVANPVDINFTQATAASRWAVPITVGLPFNGCARKVESIIATSAITNASNGRLSEMPWVQTMQGTAKNQVAVNWSAAAKGTVSLRVRMDNPS